MAVNEKAFFINKNQFIWHYRYFRTSLIAIKTKAIIRRQSKIDNLNLKKNIKFKIWKSKRKRLFLARTYTLFWISKNLSFIVINKK